jgi:aspartate/tyrosine/aromatic aminotransferase
VQQETTKSYLAIAGLPQYDRLVAELMLGAEHACLEQRRVATIQSPGGTGALRVVADFIFQHYPQATVWCSRPTWENHPKIFQAAGLAVDEYAYLDAQARGLDFAAMLDDLGRMPTGDIVVLHGCCHNPSGVDPTPAQWAEIAQILVERELLPLIDFAYQGFGTGLEPDASGLRAVAAVADELLIASSFSKNFGLYNERVGALSAIAPNAAKADVVLSHLKSCVRTNYSNPPAHGAAIVQTILQDAQLRQTWHEELAAMRERIADMRQLFVQTMRRHAPQSDFASLLQQNGMFSFSGLRPAQVDRLRQEHSIYIVRSGRINVAGITPQNVAPLCRALAAVLE